MALPVLFTLHVLFTFLFLSVSVVSVIMSMSVYKVHNVYAVLHDCNL